MIHLLFADSRCSNKTSTVGQEDINTIILRGNAMKDRGEKFFEAGSREMGTYGKMIVRDLSCTHIPVMSPKPRASACTLMLIVRCPVVTAIPAMFAGQNSAKDTQSERQKGARSPWT